MQITLIDNKTKAICDTKIESDWIIMSGIQKLYGESALTANEENLAANYCLKKIAQDLYSPGYDNSAPMANQLTNLLSKHLPKKTLLPNGSDMIHNLALTKMHNELELEEKEDKPFIVDTNSKMFAIAKFLKGFHKLKYYKLSDGNYTSTEDREKVSYDLAQKVRLSAFNELINSGFTANLNNTLVKIGNDFRNKSQEEKEQFLNEVYTSKPFHTNTLCQGASGYGYHTDMSYNDFLSVNHPYQLISDNNHDSLIDDYYNMRGKYFEEFLGYEMQKMVDNRGDFTDAQQAIIKDFNWLSLNPFRSLKVNLEYAQYLSKFINITFSLDRLEPVIMAIRNQDGEKCVQEIDKLDEYLKSLPLDDSDFSRLVYVSGYIYHEALRSWRDNVSLADEDDSNVLYKLVSSAQANSLINPDIALLSFVDKYLSFIEDNVDSISSWDSDYLKSLYAIPHLLEKFCGDFSSADDPTNNLMDESLYSRILKMYDRGSLVAQKLNDDYLIHKFCELRDKAYQKKYSPTSPELCNLNEEIATALNPAQLIAEREIGFKGFLVSKLSAFPSSENKANSDKKFDPWPSKSNNLTVIYYPEEQNSELLATNDIKVSGDCEDSSL